MAHSALTAQPPPIQPSLPVSPGFGGGAAGFMLPCWYRDRDKFRDPDLSVPVNIVNDHTNWASAREKRVPVVSS